VKPYNAKGKKRWIVESRENGARCRKGTFPRTPEGRAQAEERVKELLLEQLTNPPALNPLVDRDAVLGVEREDGTRTGYGASWLAQRGGSTRTKQSRDYLFWQHVAPFDLGGGRTLGQLRIRDITAAHVRLLVVTKRKVYSATTVRLIFRVLDPLLATAVADGILPRHPITRDLKRELQPHVKRERGEVVKAFTEEHAKLFLTTARQCSRLYSLYASQFLAGLRIGEACGLQLDDDRQAIREGKRVRELHIERQLGQECSMLDPQPGPPKNGIRDVGIAKDLGALFDHVRNERKTLAIARGWRPLPLWMSVTVNGTPYSQRNVLRDWGRVLKRAGLTAYGYTPHSARHTFASYHIARGRSPQWIKQQMGHSSIKVTFDIYGDWFKLHDQGAADEMGADLLGSGTGDVVGDAK
jgi:integrase